MTRIQTLIVSTAIAFALPSGVAFAQAPGTSTPSRSPDDVRSPMQEQAMVPNMAPISNLCGPHSVTMKDEFGRTYNCRGDRVR